MTLDIEDFAFATPAEKAHLLLNLSIAIPLADCGLEISKAIALAQEQHPGTLPYGCDLTKLDSLDTLRQAHHDTAQLINQWTG